MGLKSQYAVAVVNENNFANTAVTIGISDTTSTTLNCGGTAPTGIIFPSNWTNGTVSFKVSKTPNGTFIPLTNFDGSSYSISANANTWVPLQPAQFNSILYIQVISSVTQSAAVTVDFALAPIYQGLHS